MAQTNPNTIVLKVGSDFRTTERVAGAAVSPGHLVVLNSSDQLIKHNVSVGRALAMFALEKEYTANGITTAYASGDTVVAGEFDKNDEVYARVPAAAAAIVIGDVLVSNGDGTLKKVAASTDYGVAIALQALDNSAGGAEAFIKCKIL